MKKLYTILCAIFMLIGFSGTSWGQYTGTGLFTKVTSVEGLVDGYYVITNEEDAFLMTTGRSGSATTGYYLPADVSLADGNIVNPSADRVWLIATDGAGKTIYNEVTERYIGWSSGNAASVDVAVSDASRWTFSYADDKFTVNNVGEPLRQLSYNSSSPRFAAYGNDGQHELQFYKFEELTDPTLQSSVNSVLNLNYSIENGPSAAQSFTVSGANLDGSDVTLTAPANFGIAETEEGEYGSSVTFSNYDGSEQTLWVRLLTDLDIDNYSGNITISGGSASDVMVAVDGSVIPNYDFFEDFENGSKGGYAEEMITTNTGDWLLSDALIGTAVNDKKNGTRSVRIQNSGFIQMEFDKIDGASKVSFNHALYGSDPSGDLELFYSTDSGSSWIFAGTVSPTATLTQSEFNIDVIGIVRLKIQKSGGTRINIDDVAIFDATTGTATRTITGTEGWRMLSTPTSDNSYDDLLNPLWTQGITTGADVPNGEPSVQYYYGSAFQAVDDLTASMTAGTGFIAYIYDDQDYDGTPDGFPKTLTLSGTENEGDVVIPLNVGDTAWTLAGNPFASTIEWAKSDKNNLSETVYVYDHSYGSDYEEGDIKEIQTGGGYRTWNGSVGSLPEGKIAAFQGFWVQNNGETPSLTIPASAKSTGGTFYKSVGNEPVFVKLKSKMGNMFSEAYLSFTENGTLEINRFDAYKLSPLDFRNYMSLATSANGTLLDINNLPSDFEQIELPLHISAYETDVETMSWIGRSGEVTLSWHEMQIPENWEITLNDYETGASVVLGNSDSYTFQLSENGEQMKKATHSVLSPITPQIQTSMRKSAGERFTLTVKKGTSVPTEITDNPQQFTLEQNYPNPFNPVTSIKYNIANAGMVSLEIYNVMGQKVTTLVDEVKQSGQYQMQWNAADMASGIYYYRLKSAGQVITKKMTLIK